MNGSAQERRSSSDDVCAVVVTYHPDAELPTRLRSILGQVHKLIIVDNGSAKPAIEMLRNLATHPRISLILNPDNLGVARALNIGIERALELGVSWVLLLDQDSDLDRDMVQTLLQVFAAYPQPERLAVIGSGFRDVHQAGPLSSTDEGGTWDERESVITSGSLIPLRTHALIGPFREEFFIDYVDTDYCFRARAKGYRVIQTRRAIMSHAIGAITRHNWLGMRKWTFNHSADRRYYIARNDTVMLREYGHYRLGFWALKSLGRCVRLCKRIVLYEQAKAPKVMAVAQGWWDGVRGQMGPRQERASRKNRKMEVSN